MSSRLSAASGDLVVSSSVRRKARVAVQACRSVLAGIDGELPVGLEGVAMATHLTREEMMRAMMPGARR